VTKSVHRRGVYQINSYVHGVLNCLYRSALSLPPHIQPPIAQVPRPTLEIGNGILSHFTVSLVIFKILLIQRQK
jgi:hypothetical protein